ncbi:MAG: EamA family transporter, partial [Actinomycetia bacterium]|nr:EamA family transporter [Actinomycetes bacterium]
IGLPLGAVTAGTALLRPESLLRGLAVGLLSGVLAYTLQMDALRRMPRRLFGILVSTEPAVSALAGLVILGQRLTMPEAGGILAVVAASAGSVLTA